MFQILLITLISLLAAPLAAEQASPPNILFILADDLGSADIQQQHMPTIAALAASGTLFTRFYTEPVCGPSRAELLTGQYATRLGYSSPSRGLSAEVTTLPRVLSQSGYRSHHIGKWHLSTDLQEKGPLSAGFDDSLVFLNQWQLSPDGRPGYHQPMLSENDAVPNVVEGHLTDILTQRAVEIIESGDGQPWFINLWYFAMHDPAQPAPRYLRDKASDYQALRRQLDDSVETLLTALRDSGQLENTLIVFASDNGSKYHASNEPWPHGKGSYAEGGIRTPLLLNRAANIRAGARIDVPVRTIDLLPTLAAIAGANPVTGIDGIDLGPLLRGDAIPQRTIHWNNSILSADGELRLFSFPQQQLGPFKESAYDALGQQVEANPQQLDQLRSDYLHWYLEATRTRVVAAPQGPLLKLTGSNPMRTPGFGGFALAMAFEPGAQQLQTSTTLVDQQSVWSIRNNKGELELHLADTLFKLGTLQVDTCQSLVISGRFWRSMTNRGGEDNYKLKIYRDGAEILNISETGKIGNAITMRNPTLVGDSAGIWELGRHLQPPQLFNTSIRASRVRTAARLHTELCVKSQI